VKINFDLDYDDKRERGGKHLQDTANKVYSTMSALPQEYKRVNCCSEN